MTDILNCQFKFAMLFLFLFRSGYNRNADVVFVIRAFEYLKEKSGITILDELLKTKYEQYKNEDNVDYEPLCDCINGYAPDPASPNSAELALLKKEITNLCNYFAKKPSTPEYSLLEKCVKYRPFHVKGSYPKGERRKGGGREAEEEFVTQVLSYCLNLKDGFYEKFINLLRESYIRGNQTLEHFPALDGVTITPEESDNNGNRMDISISSSTDNGENKINIILENKVKAGFDPVQILRYCAHKDSPVVFAITYKNDCDEEGFKKLIADKNKIRAILEHHPEIEEKEFILKHIDRINPTQWGGHLFWFWNKKHVTKPSIHAIITKTLNDLSCHTIEHIYLSYFKSLIEAIKIKVVTLHEFREDLRGINPLLPGLIDKINDDKELDWNITDYSIGKTGPIFGFQIKNGQSCWPFKMETTVTMAKITIQKVRKHMLNLSRYLHDEQIDLKIKKLFIEEGGKAFEDSFGDNLFFNIELLLKKENYDIFKKVIHLLRNDPECLTRLE